MKPTLKTDAQGNIISGSTNYKIDEQGDIDYSSPTSLVVPTTNAPKQTTPTTPQTNFATPIGTSEPKISEYYTNTQTPYDTNVNNQLAYYQNIANTPEQTQDQIFESKRRQFQGEIDAVNKIYSDKISQARTTGQGNIGSSTALQARSGILGSDFGQAQTAKVQEQNKSVEDAYLNEQALKIQTILGKASSEAVQEAEQKRQAREQGVSTYLKFLSDKETRVKAKVSSLGNSLVAQGVDVTKLSSNDLNNIARNYGTTVDEVISSYKTAKNADDKMKAEIADKQRLNPTDIYGTGTIGEYNYYVAQEKSQGRTPISFGEYQTADANRKAVQVNNGLTPYQQFSATQSIAKDNAKRTENAREMARQAELIKSSYSNILNGGDRSLNTQAIITSFNKILDPTSVVRESEYDRTAAGQSLIARLEGKVQNISAGGAGVTPQTLKEASDIAETYLKNSQAYILEENQRAIDMANNFGLNSQFVTTGNRPDSYTAIPQNTQGSTNIINPQITPKGGLAF